MTADEADLVARLISGVDGGCIVCIEALCRDANRIFPDFTFEASDDPLRDPRVVVAPRFT